MKSLRVAALVVGILIWAGAPAAGARDVVSGRCPDGRAWTVDASEVAQMLIALNQARAAAGMAPLTLHSALDRMAHLHSVDMACRDFFDHDAPGRRGLKNKLARATGGSPPEWDRLGEVIGTSTTAARQMERWLASRTHRRSVLDRDHERVGIGMVRIAAGSRHTTYWTVDLMRERRPRAR